MCKEKYAAQGKLSCILEEFLPSMSPPSPESAPHTWEFPAGFGPHTYFQAPLHLRLDPAVSPQLCIYIIIVQGVIHAIHPSRPPVPEGTSSS